MANVDPWWRDSAADEELRKFDKLAHAVTIIDEEHRLVHDGMAFGVGHIFASVANGGTAALLVSTGAEVFPHVRALDVTAENGPLDLDFYEGVTTSNDGTAITPANRNRASSIVANAAWYHTPTITDLGTQLGESFIPVAAVQGNRAVPAIASSFGEEWVLDQNQKYALVVTNNSGGAARLQLRVFYYEIGYPS